MSQVKCSSCGCKSEQSLCPKCGEAVGLLLLGKASMEKRYDDALTVIGETSKLLAKCQDEKKDLHSKACSLLAVIHRDGGHFTFKNGVEKSLAEAERIFVDLLQEVESLRRQYHLPIQAKRVLEQMTEDDCDNALDACSRFPADDNIPEISTFEWEDLLESVVKVINERKLARAQLQEISDAREDIAKLKKLIQ